MCQLHAYSDHKYLILLSRILINGCLQKFLSLIIPTKLPCQTMSKRERWLSSFHASCLLLPSHCPPFSFFFFLNSPLHKNIVLLAIDKALLLNNSTAICSQHSPLLLCLCCDVISHENKLNCWNFPDHTIFLSFLHIYLFTFFVLVRKPSLTLLSDVDRSLILLSSGLLMRQKLF